jgi:MYXO-CTERM domain-containing protein
VRYLLVASSLFALTTPALADTTPQPLPFLQNWSNTGLVTTDDDWSGVPGIIGYRGDGLASTTGVDPQTITAESTIVDVNANRTDPNTFATGGIAEFELADPVVALNGSSTASAPHLVVTFTTTGKSGITVAYALRDLDGSADNSMQQVALQYRVGTTGAFTNVPAGYVMDASSGPSLATLVTNVSATLPAAVDNQPVVQIRIITTNAMGNDEWIGVDDLSITFGSSSPSATGMTSPASAERSAAVTLTAAVTRGTGPTSTGLAVACDLTSIGGSATQALFDDGTNGDGLAGDNVWTLATTVGAASAVGAKTFACTVSDAESRSSTFAINFTVAPTCGDGAIEGAEACDDGDTDPGDGCSATCTLEPGWVCNGEPTTCADIDECADNTDDCDALAVCTNTPGSFTCACATGYAGTGHGANGCTDIDECAANTDTCDPAAMCTNTAGSFTCACPTGFTGDGYTTGTGCTDIDECTANTDDCVAAATCTNTVGGFICTCPMGYGGDGRTSGSGCIDIDECTMNTDNCDANATCTNTVGSFTCACNTGFTGTGVTCTDIDECTANTDDCVTQATCNNTVGAFTCSCPAGYGGDGRTSGTGCTDIDECTAGTDNCDANATCTNTTGSFTCACKPGYTGSGTSCTDVDECTAGTDNCDANATCANTPGSFTCTCAAGFSGNGVQCMANCGDGALKSSEACDDGNLTTGDGCNANCVVEEGYECSGAPSTCSPICGDGLRVGAEECDDTNTDPDDGCNAQCRIEDGWTCTGEPSTCEPPDDGGCCSSSAHPGGVALLVLFVIAGLRRRQRG